jgi:hypothetical protein
MKIQAHKKDRGSALLVTMLFILTAAAIAIGYLAMVQNSHQLVARSQRWNDSLVLAESGVEEALAGLNSASGFTGATRTLNGGTYSVKYYSASPGYILSTGSVAVPLTGDMISRKVKVVVATQTPTWIGLGTILSINMNGNGISADSFNSYDPSQSNQGLYNGYVGTNSNVASVQGAVSIGNHTIDGNLYLGPNASYGGSGTVTGTIYSDWNISFPDVTLPTTDTNGNAVVWTPAPVTNITGTATHVFNSNGYYSINDNNPVTVQPGVTVYLNVQSAIAYNPSGLTINGGTTNSGNVRMYLQSASVTLSGNSAGGAVNNRAQNLEIFGLPSVAGITMSGNSTFVGVIYAPEASLTLNGGGNNSNLIGAAIVSTVTLNGHYDFHYDTSLSTNGPPAGYVVSSWQEL